MSNKKQLKLNRIGIPKVAPVKAIPKASKQSNPKKLKVEKIAINDPKLLTSITNQNSSENLTPLSTTKTIEINGSEKSSRLAKNK